MNAPQTRMQSKPSLVNATASLRPQQTQRSSSSPFTASSDQASTAAPTDDEQSMCGRVEALRFGRRGHELSNGLTQSRGAPSRTFEAPRTFAHRRDSDLHSNKLSMPSSVPSHITGHHPPASEPPWKVLVLSSWLLLRRLAVNAPESNCAHFLEARLGPKTGLPSGPWFVPNATLPLSSAHRKGTWGTALLIVRGLLRLPSLSGSPTVTSCSVHIHNVVAKKRGASTDLLRRLHAHMVQHNVDFTGGTST